MMEEESRERWGVGTGEERRESKGRAENKLQVGANAWQDFRFRVTPMKPYGKLIRKCPNHHYRKE